ncbi:galactose mutarotase-like protein [Dentipellis sp. KUC8613]|nr:galactose mutarotase-like protein [Dentipellis sp. KUC8613]
MFHHLRRQSFSLPRIRARTRTRTSRISSSYHLRTAMSDAAFSPILLALPSLTPSLALEVLPHGVTLHRLFVQTDGRTHDLLVGPEDPKGHLAQKYTNTLIGRYTNRVPVGTHTVSSNGATAQVTPQANSSATPTVSLHGGPAGYDAATWDVFPLDAVAGTAASSPISSLSAASPPGSLFTPAELATFQTTLPQGASALFRHVSPDGDQGYPGTLLLEVVVGLLPPQAPSARAGEFHLGSVVLLYRAKLLDAGAKTVTPINLTQHWGFNLEASLKGDTDLSVKGHELTIKASDTVDIDDAGLPTGALSPVKGTAHEHHKKLIGDRFPEGGISTLGDGYDHFYVFEKREQPPTAAHHIPTAAFTPEADFVKDVLGARPQEGIVELASQKSGLRLVFNSNQSGVQFYSNNLATGDGARKKIHGGSGNAGPGEGYGPGSAVFLEFHEPHASFLYPSLNPSGDDTLLHSDEVYNNFVRVDVLYKSPQGL